MGEFFVLGAVFLDARLGRHRLFFCLHGPLSPPAALARPGITPAVLDAAS
jgi:hypothetical protein